jgi:hypothetical protein
MRIKAILAGATIAAALTLTACSSPATTGASGAADTSTAAASQATLTGSFSGLNGKKVSGDVTIAGDTITLANFASDQGPDLHLYLANGTSEAATTAGVEIDSVAWDKASQTITLPSGTDAAKYKYLVEHCDKALAVFGAAALSK